MLSRRRIHPQIGFTARHFGERQLNMTCWSTRGIFSPRETFRLFNDRPVEVTPTERASTQLLPTIVEPRLHWDGA